MACAPDLSYAAIADCTRHVYVYRSQVGVDPSSELRHRKSGRGCATVSKQYVVTLEAEGSDASEPVTSAAMPHRSSRPENILGLHCADEFIFVLTAQHFYAIRVKF